VAYQAVTALPPTRSVPVWKRTIDLVLSSVGLVVLSPVLIIIAIAITLDNPGPVFFRQERVGRGGVSFRIFKFRTMIVDADRAAAQLTVCGDKRITKVGHWLRRSKLDELPQLINIFLGEMSLVGPRPEVPQFMQFYTPDQRAIILSMRPGTTDYAAIVFHDESSLLDQERDPVELYRREIMPAKFALYQKYFLEMSLVTDLRIVIGTVMLLVAGRIPKKLQIANPLQKLRLSREKTIFDVSHPDAQVDEHSTVSP
jgi:lipopolysaccharide/colanic/teichoic acid biosynthesis glycosyltransferase